MLAVQSGLTDALIQRTTVETGLQKGCMIFSLFSLSAWCLVRGPATLIDVTTIPASLQPPQTAA